MTVRMVGWGLILPLNSDYILLFGSFLSLQKESLIAWLAKTIHWIVLASQPYLREGTR